MYRTANSGTFLDEAHVFGAVAEPLRLRFISTRNTIGNSIAVVYVFVGVFCPIYSGRVHLVVCMGASAES